jgi:hypothetical protein
VFLEQDGMDEDGDRDGLPTPWEVQFGLNPDVGSGADGADGDPDGDGKSNREELLAETHPRGLFTRYFAEGVTSDFFDLRAAFLNPNPTVARVLVHFQTTAGTTEHYALAVPPTANRTLIPKMLPRMNEAAFSMVIESDQPVVADRRVTWDARSHPYGSHAETSIASPATTWYLAEGATHSGFNLFYLVQNPNDVAVDVHVKYLLPSGALPPWSARCISARRGRCSARGMRVRPSPRPRPSGFWPKGPPDLFSTSMFSSQTLVTRTLKWKRRTCSRMGPR